MSTEVKLNLLEEIQNIIQLEMEKAQLEAIPFILERPRNITFGDISSNFLMILRSKKIEEEKIKILLNEILKKLNSIESIKEIKLVGGFINISIELSHYEQVLLSLEKREKDKILRANEATKEKISHTPLLHFEFGSINPNGPVHLGHIRTITVANCLSNLLVALGFKIYKEFFLNDCGNQIENFLTSIYFRWQERHGHQEISIEDIPYKGEYIKDLIPKEMDPHITLENFLVQYKENTIEQVKNNILGTLKSYGVHYHMVRRESDLHKDQHLIYRVINTLIEKKLIAFVEEESQEDTIDLSLDYPVFYGAITQLPQGKRTILLSKNMDFEKNKVLIRSNGTLTYFAADILYLFDKIERGFNNQYCFLGEDHIGHLNMLTSLAKRVFPHINFIVKKVGFVKVLDENRQIIPMSKRSGQFLSMEEAEKKIGRDFLKLIMISRCINGELVFSMEEAKEENIKKNCLFYIQYCCTRIASVLRKADPILIDQLKNQNFSNGQDWYIHLIEEEKLILRHLLWFDTIMNDAAINQDMNQIYQYIYDLAAYFHGYFTAGTRDVGMRFITGDSHLTAHRIRILLVIEKIMHYLLGDILNIKPLNQM